jgi:D-glycero-alpha-D-manno-heptose-7-phosphate kinase
MSIRETLEQNPVEASAPCRIDMGGTLDLSTFFYPLQRLHPCTFNAALDLRTYVRVSPFDTGKVKISSHGFEDLVVESASAPYDHPLGLMLAVGAYFNADGAHIEIHSSSPPRSALGGSSVAAVALIWAFSKARAERGHPMPSRSSVAMLAHAIEQSVAGVPCGMQDHLAAVYGGINAWHWLTRPPDLPFRRQRLASADGCKAFERHILVAYCGRPHVSKDVNATWVKQFVRGSNRRLWHGIIDCSRKFVSALEAGDYQQAKTMMNQETDIRCELTPEVLDALGARLVAAAREGDCGARFTGAGGGGCVWALGAADDIKQLRPVWKDILTRHSAAQLLKAGIDTAGLL